MNDFVFDEYGFFTFLQQYKHIKCTMYYNIQR